MAISNGQTQSQIGLQIFTHNVAMMRHFYCTVFSAEVVRCWGRGPIAVEVRMFDAHYTIVRSRAKIHDIHTGFVMTVYVPSTDWAVEQALKLGARSVKFLGSSPSEPVVDTLTGDRAGRIIDPAGYVWEVRTCLEEVEADEALARARQARHLQSR